MKRQMILCLMIISFCAATVVAQSTVTDIRKVDFRNFTYSSSLCSQEYGRQGIGKIVRVSNGEFKNKNVYFTVDDKSILYADVTGDGHEDAIVPIDCGATAANFSRTEIQIYTIRNGRAMFLAEITDKDMERDYRANYADAEGYWGTNENGIKTNNGNVVIEVLADGPHAGPKYIVTMEYHLNGNTFRLNGKPPRKSAGQ
ncbi:MAG TPA: hypothetical protein DC054_02075 [Blastocatellia bacterium]|nr:hypothetical protein [Blastocatellia bacterium]